MKVTSCFLIDFFKQILHLKIYNKKIQISFRYAALEINNNKHPYIQNFRLILEKVLYPKFYFQMRKFYTCDVISSTFINIFS